MSTLDLRYYDENTGQWEAPLANGVDLDALRTKLTTHLDESEIIIKDILKDSYVDFGVLSSGSLGMFIVSKINSTQNNRKGTFIATDDVSGIPEAGRITFISQPSMSSTIVVTLETFSNNLYKAIVEYPTGNFLSPFKAINGSGSNTNLDNTKKTHFISAVIRYTPASGWYVQNNADHRPIGISSVAVVDGKVRINYNFTATYVNTLLVTPDEELGRRGYVTSGSSVGLSAADFAYTRHVDIYGRLSNSAGVFSVDFNSPLEYPLTITDSGGGVIRVHHDNLGADLPLVLTGYVDSHTPQVNYQDKDYFEVMWFDKSTGAQVTTIDAKCRCYFRKGGTVTPNASTGYPYENGNFWVVGIMEE